MLQLEFSIAQRPTATDNAEATVALQKLEAERAELIKARDEAISRAEVCNEMVLDVLSSQPR